MQNRKKFVLHPPLVQGNQVFFSWSPNGPFQNADYKIEYPGLEAIEGSPGKLAEAYFPICAALSFLGPVDIELPARLPYDLLDQWRKLITTLHGKCDSQTPDFRLLNGAVDAQYKPLSRQKTALLFGGGTESLLTLARIRMSEPILVSLGGENWAGSNPRLNPNKFEMDKSVAHEFNLERAQVFTNFRSIFDQAAWSPYLKENISMMNAVLALPSFLSFLFPVCEQLGISHIVNGNEAMNYPDEYYCFSPAVTDHLSGIAKGVSYRSYLNDIFKEEVCFELYREHPRYAKFQYSCWRNNRRRWCCRCQSCLEYFMLMKNSGFPHEEAGLMESEIRANLDELIWETAKSDEARPNEIWERLFLYPRLRRDPFLNSILLRVKRRTMMYRAYCRLPDSVKFFYRAARKGFGRSAHLAHACRQWLSRARPYCWLVSGAEKTGGGPISFVYAGTERHKNYFAHMACGQLKDQPLGRQWIWKIPKVAESGGFESAFTVYEASGAAAWWTRFKTFFKIPMWVESGISLSGTTPDVTQGQGFAKVRRRIRRAEFEPLIPGKSEGLDFFYHDMYVPYVAARHGVTAYIESLQEIKNRLEEGELLFVKDRKHVVAGALIEYQNGVGTLRAVGVRRGFEYTVQEGSIGALYLFVSKRVQQLKKSRISFGYSHAYLNDGVYQFKSQLGAQTSHESHGESGFWAFRFHAANEAVKNFLIQNPFISHEAAGPEIVLFMDKYDADAARAYMNRAHERFQRFSIYVFEPPQEKNVSLHFPEFPRPVIVKSAFNFFPKPKPSRLHKAQGRPLPQVRPLPNT